MPVILAFGLTDVGHDEWLGVRILFSAVLRAVVVALASGRCQGQEGLVHRRFTVERRLLSLSPSPLPRLTCTTTGQGSQAAHGEEQHLRVGRVADADAITDGGPDEGVLVAGGDDGSSSGDSPVVGVFVQVGVVALLGDVASDPGVEDALAPVSLFDTGVYCRPPEAMGEFVHRAVSGTHVVVGDGGGGRVPAHCVHLVALGGPPGAGGCAEQVVAVDFGTGGRSSHSDGIAYCGDDADYGGTVVVQWMHYLVGAVVVVVLLGAIDTSGNTTTVFSGRFGICSR